MATTAPDLREIGAAFAVDGVWQGARREQSGHINETWVVAYESEGRVVRYVHQAINEHVFPDVTGLMRNVERVTAHLRARTSRVPDERRWEVPTLVPSRSGDLFWRCGENRVWRTFLCIEEAESYDVAPSVGVAREAAAAFGRFAAALSDFDPAGLVEPLPGFHDLDGRLARLEQVIERDGLGRAAAVGREIDLIREHAPRAATLGALRAAGELPERVVHNDTKVNNALIDVSTGHGIAVIDLDTVMPGTILYDFGDLVRTATSRAAEDEVDLSRVAVAPDLFAAISEGYLSEVAPLLTPAEREHLLLGGMYMVLIIAVRFLTDHIEGDPYFPAHRPGQNLDRARVQLKLLESLVARKDALQATLDRACGR